MTETESYLKERWFAYRSIGRLMMDLSVAKSGYEQALCSVTVSMPWDEVKVKKQQGKLSPVEYSAVMVIDHYRAEMESIERRLSDERRKAAVIERTVLEARLLPREREYVRLRYFENRSVQATAQRLFCSAATCGRLRESALSKVESVLGGSECQEA